ncbi:hypothetical protein P7H00_08890 [Enterococcus pseudoavium]|uniref:Uncharacterized protein n=1 Tax=Enterococcus pseudoavium TaxID=44007 RepID=A0AAE4I0I9_9ENTE|nr:hypothetical protein [Enterococcus pseudoavium]MDT2737244.1 hypothetical protein [Enterococcus pseudoavium]
MKKEKVLGNIFLSIILCLPLLGFRYSDETSSIETASTSVLKTKMTDSLSRTTSTTVEEMTESTIGSTNSENSEATTENSEPTEEATLTEEGQKIKLQRSTIATEPVSEKFFVSITDQDYELLKEPDGERVNDNKKNYQKTFAAQEINNNSAITYYLLSTPTAKLGYIAANSVEKVAGEEGQLFP